MLYPLKKLQRLASSKEFRDFFNSCKKEGRFGMVAGTSFFVLCVHIVFTLFQVWTLVFELYHPIDGVVLSQNAEQLF